MARKYINKAEEDKKKYTKRSYDQVKYSAPQRRIIIFLLLLNGNKLTLDYMINEFEIEFPDIIYDDLNRIDEAARLIKLNDKYELPYYQKHFDNKPDRKWYYLEPVENGSRIGLKRIEDKREENLNRIKNNQKEICPYTQADRTLLILQLLIKNNVLDQKKLVEIFETTPRTIKRDIKLIEDSIDEMSTFGCNYIFYYDEKLKKFVFK